MSIMIDRNELIEVIALALDCPTASINFESGLGHHLNWDSLGHLCIMGALEDRYKIEINENNITKMLTVRDISEYLENNI